MFSSLSLLNHQISTYLNSFTQFGWLDAILPIFADVPIFLIPLFLVGYWIYATKIKKVEIKNTLLFIFYTDIIAGWLNLLIQQFVYVERPATFLQVKWSFILSHIPDNSFPSDHAAIGTAFIIALALFGYKKTAYILTPIFILMFLARIIGGVHYPFDILGGIIVGILSWYVTMRIKDSKLIQRVNTVIVHMMERIYL